MKPIQTQRDTFAIRLAMPAESHPIDTHLHMTQGAVSHYKQAPPRGQSSTPHPSLVQNIAKNGMQRPVEIMTDGERGIMSDGNHRLSAAQQLGMSHLPVSVQQVPPIVMDNLRRGVRPRPIESELAAYLKSRAGED